MSLHIALYQPEIAPNTGNIIRLCANTDAMLHIIHPIGFNFTDKQLRRAGLDYHDLAHVKHYDDYQHFGSKFSAQRIFACSSKGHSNYAEQKYRHEDVFLLGPETRGLPPELLSTMPTEQVIRIPMATTTRSLNLANATAIILYEAWKQLGFCRF